MSPERPEPIESQDERQYADYNLDSNSKALNNEHQQEEQQ